MLKILQARFQKCVTSELPDVQLGLKKTEEPEIKLPTSVGSSKKQESSTKISTSALMTMPKPLTVWITTNCGKFLNRWDYQTTWPASREICVQVNKQQLEPDMEQLTGSKLGKEYVKAVYCHPAYLTYMQSTSWENALSTWCEELPHLKRPWWWERLKVGGEGDDRGWDGWLASPTQWTWVWVNFGSWWQGSLVGCSTWISKELEMTEWLNWTELRGLVYLQSLISPF